MNFHIKMSKGKKRIIMLFTAMIVLVCFSFGIREMAAGRKSIVLEWLLFTFIFCCSFYLFAKGDAAKQKLNSLRQIYVPAFLVTLFWDLAALSPYTVKTNMIMVYGLLSLNIFFILLTRILISEWDRSGSLSRIKAYVRENIGVFLICAVFILASLEIFFVWLNEDGMIYYTQLSEMKNWDFVDLSILQLADHHSELLTILLMIGEFLIPNKAVGVRIVMLLLAVFTIFAFYHILRLVFKNITRTEQYLATGIFAFSPYLFGMISEINLDFPLICFVVWMYYFYLKKQYIAQAFCGLLLCFTKEPGCFIYGTFIVGILCTIVWENRQNIRQLMNQIFSKKMIVNYLGGVLWIAYYIISKFESWMQNNSRAGTEQVMNENLQKHNSFSIWYEYIVHRLKEIFAFNYAWLIWTIATLCIIVILFKIRGKIRFQSMKKFIPLLASGVGMIVVDILYITYPHIRYNIPFLLIQSVILTGAVLYAAKGKKLKIAIMSGLLVITVLSNYVTDPISAKLFVTYDAGNGSIICPRLYTVDADGYCRTDDMLETDLYALLNEGVAYNRQFLGRSQCIEGILKAIDYQEGDLIIAPNVTNDTSVLYRNVLLRKEAWPANQMMWNTSRKVTNANYYSKEELCTGAEWIHINIMSVNEGDEVPEDVWNRYKRIIYLKLPINDAYDHNPLLSKYNIQNEWSITRNVWKLEAYQLTK